MKILLFIFFMITSISSQFAYAEPDGTCWTDPPKIFTFTFSGETFSKNKAGTTARLNFGRNEDYKMKCAPNPGKKILGWNKASFGVNAIADGNILHISEQLDAVVTIYTTNYGNTPTVVPYSDVKTGGAITPDSSTETGTYASSGYIDLTLVKDAVGGAIVIPPGLFIYSSYRSTEKGIYAEEPVTQGYTAGQIIPVDTTCTINNGATINVPFGDIEAVSLKSNTLSSTIKKDININYACSTSITQDIDITLIATQASFDSTGIQTSISNVAVVMMYNGQPVAPYDHFRTKLVDGVGSDTITFVPIIMEGAENVQGAFTASATLVMTSA